MSSHSRSTFRRLLFPMSGLIALASFLHACGGGGGGGGGGNPPAPNPGPGPTTFTSTSQFPTDSSVNVPIQPIILVGFNDTVNPATVNTTTVTMTQGATPVPATPTYVSCTNQIQVLPNAALAPNTAYTVNLTAGLLDDDGETLTAMSFTFTTRASTDSDRPTFSVGSLSAIPNPGTETTAVQLDWLDGSDGLNAPGTISYRVYMSTVSGCFDYSAAVLTTGPGVLQAVVPGLIPRTAYSFSVRAVDAAGNESLNTDSFDQTTNTSFLTNVYPLVSQFCISCHNPPNGQAWLNNPVITMDYSTPATVYSSWVNVTPSQPGAANAGMMRVDPGNAANSFLYNKINSATPVAGSQMPLGQQPLSGPNQDIIFDWITEGALDN